MFLWKKVKRRFFGKQTPNGAAAQERFIAGALPKRLDSPLQYPPVWRDEERYDTYQSEKDHEVLVKDPYHWLEIDSAERDQFIDGEQGQATLTLLDRLICLFRSTCDHTRILC